MACGSPCLGCSDALADSFLRILRIDIAFARGLHMGINGRVAILGRDRIRIPVSMLVYASYQGCRPTADRRSHMRGKIKDPHADAHVVGIVGVGAVDDAFVMTGKLPGLEHKIDRTAVVDFLDRLSARQQVFVVIGFDVRINLARMGPGE